MVTDDKGKTEGGIFVQFETAFNKASLNSGRTGLDAISGFGSVGTTGAISKGSEVQVLILLLYSFAQPR